MEFPPNPPPFTVHRRGNTSDMSTRRARGRGSRNDPLVVGDSPDAPPNVNRVQTPRQGAPSIIVPHTRTNEDLNVIRARIIALEGGVVPGPSGGSNSSAASNSDGSGIGSKNSSVGGGSRAIRERNLAAEDLWVNQVGPKEDILPSKAHHKCSVCHLVKSHPVSYVCGHSHCYMCVRLHLESDWGCPKCARVMYQAPFRQYAEEDALVAEYPERRDGSIVEYKWDGLVFPKRPEQVEVDVPGPAAGRIWWKYPYHATRFSALPSSSFIMVLGRRPKAKVDVDVGDNATGESTTVSADRGVYYSADGYRRQEELLNVTHKKRRVQPSELDDSYGEWIPAPGRDNDDGNLEGADWDTFDAVATKKRKSYASSDDPMSLWRPLKGYFLDELVRHDSLGDDLDSPECAHCYAKYDAIHTRIFKCVECGVFLQCGDCCLNGHVLTPLHTIEEWKGEFWAEFTLRELGLVYQLGHGGFPCVFPVDRVHKMTVIEAPIIHIVNMRYCNCDKADHTDNIGQLMRNTWYPATMTDPATCATFNSLEAFRLYNVVGNMNVNDFIHAMERKTDATASTGMKWLPDRYKQFQRMARQWAFLKRIKRAGRAHDPAGVDKTGLRECAVICWACPYEGRNLPVNWRDVDPQFRFLYMLLLAVDANFKLKNRMRANQINDPSLGPGWSYFVGPRGYKRHLRKYVAEKDHLYCVRGSTAKGHTDDDWTMMLRRGRVRLRPARVCPTERDWGLTERERYSNMDYIVMSALAGFTLLLLMLSYDIACQWKKNMPERNAKMPSEIRLHLDKFTYQYALPVWHAASHNEDCQNDNSLSFKTGVGKSDGEGVERVWAVLNPAAYHTKDAGEGQRIDVLEDKIDNHNHLKNLGQGDALQRKLLVAIAERERQVQGFTEISATIERPLRKEWKRQIDAWLKDPTQLNPFTLQRNDCPSEAEVRLELKRDEDAAVAAAVSPIQGRSATAFLIAGLQIEEAQRRISLEVLGPSLVSADRENKIYDWRKALLAKIAKFRDLQKTYMPGAAHIIAAAEAGRDPDAQPPKPEKIKLFMPSQMPDNEPLRGCVPRLLTAEAKLRVGQSTNALVKLRARLHAKRHLITFRNENVTGQIGSTKARTLIGQVGERVEACAAKYRHAREALISLQGPEAIAKFKELRPQDVQLDGDEGESDAAARKKLAMIGSGREARVPRNAPGTSKKVMSWIWTAPGALDDAEQHLHDSIRVEWSRARARKLRWHEEVLTLREEMRRVLRYLAWQSSWWREHAGLRQGLSAAVGAGVRGYALKQADLHNRLAAHFEKKWNMPAIEVAQRLVDFDLASSVEDADLDRFFE
ncbi:hypothetical protein C8R44DRAFT_890661 [Mycena epipterygia]|nr:hypothetical protein C8R44DRAFT_890661 [Mycena epipterygia]